MDVTDRVIKRLKARRDLGVRIYGKGLKPHDGTDALQEALDEALDLAQYLMQLVMERE